MNLNERELASLIKQEIKRIVDEERLVDPDDLSRDEMAMFVNRELGDDSIDGLEKDDYGERDHADGCPVCGDYHYASGAVSKCPGSMSTDNYVDYLTESCGCGAPESTPKSSGMNDYSLERSIDHDHDKTSSKLGHFDNLAATNITPDEAFQAGQEVCNDKNNGYMAKPQLYKISKYAKELYDMLPDTYNMTDWQRSHLSSIADDISEVYHSLEHKLHKGEI